MGSKTLIGGALSMQSTPLGPWGVGASAGPATAGLGAILTPAHIFLWSRIRAWERG